MIATRIFRAPSVLRPLLLALAVVATSAVAAHAQSSADSAIARKLAQSARADRAGAPAGLELTVEQRAKLAAITNKHADEGKAIGELFQTDPDAAMKRMVTLRAKVQAEMRAVLTPEQRTIFDRNIAELNAQIDARRPTSPH